MTPLLLWKRALSRFRPIPNYCKRCGRDTEAFRVPDHIYREVVPDGRERCFRCFHRAATRGGRPASWIVWLDASSVLGADMLCGESKS